MHRLCITFGFAAALLAGSVDPGHADRARWCAVWGDSEGGTECLYHSMAQCQATVRGMGGMCTENQSSFAAPSRSNRSRNSREYGQDR